MTIINNNPTLLRQSMPTLRKAIRMAIEIPEKHCCNLKALLQSVGRNSPAAKLRATYYIQDSLQRYTLRKRSLRKRNKTCNWSSGPNCSWMRRKHVTLLCMVSQASNCSLQALKELRRGRVRFRVGFPNLCTDWKVCDICVHDQFTNA